MALKVISEPTLALAFDFLKKNIFSTINCHAIGRIESFDALTQTAKISIAYQKRSVNDGIEEISDYPALVDCPVLVLSGGDGSIRFPISAGDNCIVLFNDRDIDNWYGSGTKTILNTDRQHAFTDAMAIVGLRSFPDAMTDYDADKTQIVHDQTKISLSDKVKIENATNNLYTILDGLFGILENLTTTNAVLGAPCTLNPAQIAQVAAFRSQLDLLME